MNRDLKYLQRRRSEIEQELSDVGKQIEELVTLKRLRQEEHSKISRQINEILQDVTVTEHAIIRYFERVLGFNLSEISKKILPDVDKQRIKQLVNCEYPMGDFKLVVKSNKVVSVLTNDMKSN
jgi:Txe/YoeB family toxin of Txe-Axe toxin-antitoxin module